MSRFLSILVLVSVGVCVSPELIPASSNPCDVGSRLVVTFPSAGAVNKHKKCGDKVDLVDVSGAKAPDIHIEIKDELFIAFAHLQDGMTHDDDEDASFYTLVMVDPDAGIETDKAKQKYYLHWLMFDIQGADLTSGNGLAVKEYRPPSPPAGSGTHRYQFFAFKQDDEFTDFIEGVPELRSTFDLKQFLEDNGFKTPVAGYEFVTENV